MKTTEHLVLLPGMMCDERLWREQIETLNPHCASINVADITHADSIEKIAATVLEKVPQEFALAGLSMGGIVAFEIWRQAPERIKRIALFDTNPLAETKEKKASRDELLARVIQGELKQVLIDALKPRYLAKANQDNQQLLDEIISMAINLGEDVFTRQSNALRHRPDSLETLKTIDVPALILCGKEDALCPPEFHELMATQIPNARLIVLDDCGHLSTMEQPVRVTEEMLTWLKTN